MPKIVEIPDRGTIEFPDSMGDEQINQAINRQFYVEPAVKAAVDSGLTVMNAIGATVLNPLAAEASAMGQLQNEAERQEKLGSALDTITKALSATTGAITKTADAFDMANRQEKRQQYAARKQSLLSEAQHGKDIVQGIEDITPAVEGFADPLGSLVRSAQAWGKLLGGTVADVGESDVFQRPVSQLPAALMEKATGTAQKSLGGFRNIKAAIAGEELPTQIEAASVKGAKGALAGAVLGTAETLPMLGTGMVLSAANPELAPLFFGTLFGLESYAKSGDPQAAMRSAALGAALPPIAHKGTELGAELASRAGVSSNLGQKVVELVGNQTALQAAAHVANLPDYVNMTPQERKKAAMETTFSFLMFAAAEVGKFHPNVESLVQQSPDLLWRVSEKSVDRLFNSPSAKAMIDEQARFNLSPQMAQLERQGTPDIGKLGEWNRAVELVRESEKLKEADAPLTALALQDQAKTALPQLEKPLEVTLGDTSVKVVPHPSGVGFGVLTTVKGENRLIADQFMTVGEAQDFAFEQLKNSILGTPETEKGVTDANQEQAAMEVAGGEQTRPPAQVAEGTAEKVLPTSDTGKTEEVEKKPFDFKAAGREAKANYDEAVQAAGDADAIEMQSPKYPGLTVVISRDPSEQGKWRASRFDDRGASGHNVYETREKAISDYTGGHDTAGPSWGWDFKVTDTQKLTKETPAPPAEQPVAESVPEGGKAEATQKPSETIEELRDEINQQLDAWDERAYDPSQGHESNVDMVAEAQQILGKEKFNSSAREFVKQTDPEGEFDRGSSLNTFARLVVGKSKLVDRFLPLEQPKAIETKPGTEDPRTLTDEQLSSEMSAVEMASAPFYKQLEAIPEGEILAKGGKLSPRSKAIEDQLKPLSDRMRLLDFEVQRRKLEALNKQRAEARDKRIAEAPVWQTRNGWEIVRDGFTYVLRDPTTKTDVYSGKLTRVREVADESRPSEEQPSESASSSFMDWRVQGTTVRHSNIGKRITPAEAKLIMQGMADRGMRGRYDDKKGVVILNSGLLDDLINYWHEGGSYAKKQQARELAKEKRKANESERQSIESKSLAENPATGWIENVFGDALNDYNRLALARFLTGEESKFRGIVNWKWESPLQQIGAITADKKIDWGRLIQVYESQKTKPTKIEGGEQPNAQVEKEKQEVGKEVLRDVTPAEAQGAAEIPKPSEAAKTSSVVDTIAGRMDLSEFEKKGYAPEQVTKQNWIDLQRAERRRLGQSEESGTRNAPYADYEEFHKNAVREAIAKGEQIDPEVLADYPELKPSVSPVESAPEKAPEPTLPIEVKEKAAAETPQVSDDVSWKTGAGDTARATVQRISKLPNDTEPMADVDWFGVKRVPVSKLTIVKKSSRRIAEEQRANTPAAAVSQITKEVKQVAKKEGSRPAKQIKAELVAKLEEALSSASSETSLPQEQLAILKKAQSDSFPEVGSFGYGKREDEQKAKAIAAEKVKRIEAAKAAGLKQVTFDIPGDGEFTIWNTKESISKVLEAAKKINTRGVSERAANTPLGKLLASDYLKRDIKDAITVYGDEAKAYQRLNSQLLRAEALELEPEQVKRLEKLVGALKNRIEAPWKKASERLNMAEDRLKAKSKYLGEKDPDLIKSKTEVESLTQEVAKERMAADAILKIPEEIKPTDKAETAPVEPETPKPAAVKPEPAKVEVEAVKEPPKVEFEHPAPKTPEAEALQSKREAAVKAEDELRERLDRVKSEADKAGYGTKRREAAEAKRDKLQNQLWEMQRENEPLHESSRMMYLEHLVQTGDPAQRWAATVELLQKRAGKLQKEGEKIVNEMGREERSKGYDLITKARVIGSKAREVSDEAYKMFSESVAKELESLGATPEEAKSEAGQIVNMQMSYPGMNSVKEAPLRMMAIEGERTRKRVEDKADALRKEYGVIADTGLDQRLRTALPDEKRANEILAEYKERYEQNKREIRAKELARDERAKLDQQNEIAKAQALQASGKLQWRLESWENKPSIWKAVEGKTVNVPAAPDHEFFVWKSGKGEWSVNEKSTGLRINAGSTQGEAIERSSARISETGIEKFKEVVAQKAKEAPPIPKLEEAPKSESISQSVNFGMGVATKEAGDLVARAQQMRQKAQSDAQSRLASMSEQEINGLSEDQLDSLLADVTNGPGNKVQTMNWKKADLVEALLREKSKLEPAESQQIPQGPGAATRPQGSEEAPEFVSGTALKNAVGEMESAGLGTGKLPEADKSVMVDKWIESGMELSRNPMAGRDLVLRLTDNPNSGLSDLESATLLRYKRVLLNSIDAAAERAIRLSGTAEGAAAEMARQERLNEFKELLDSVKARGTSWGREGVWRQAIAEEDFSLETVRAGILAERAKGKEPGEAVGLSDVEEARLKEMVKNLETAKANAEKITAETEQKLAETEAQKELLQIERDALQEMERSRPKYDPELLSLAERVVGNMKRKADQAERELMEMFNPSTPGGPTMALSGLGDPAVFDRLVIWGAGRLAEATWDAAQFARELVNKFGDAVAPYLQGTTLFDAAMQRKLADYSEVQAPVRRIIERQATIRDDSRRIVDIARGKLAGLMASGDADKMYFQVKKMMRGFVEEGIRGWRPLADAVHRELRSLDPEWDFKDTLAMVSGNGRFKPLSKEDVDVAARSASREMSVVRNIQKIIFQRNKEEADIPESERLKRSGIEFPTPSDTERRLRAIFNDLKKKYGIKASDVGSELRSALQARNTYYDNRIEDLKWEIENEQKIIRNKSAPPTNPELEAKISEYKRLKEERDSLFEEGITEEERLRRALRAAERSELEWNQRLQNARNGIYDPVRQARRPVTNAELEEIRARITASKEEVQQFKDLDGAYQERLQAEKILADIAEYERKLEAKEFGSEPETEKATTPRLEELKNARLLARAAFQAAKDASPEMMENALKRAVELGDELQRRINEGDITPKPKEGTAPTTPEIEAQKSENAELQKIIQKLRSAQKPKKTMQEIAEQSFLTRKAREFADLQRRIVEKDFTKEQKRKRLLNPAELSAKAKVEGAKEELRALEVKERTKNRYGYERLGDFVSKFRRMGVLSSPLVIPKLMSAGAQRLALMPIEDLIGTAWQKLPMVGDVARLAQTEGHKFSRQIGREARAAAFLKTQREGESRPMTQVERDMRDVMRTGKTELDLKYGKGKHGYSGEKEFGDTIMEMPGRIHGMIKTPVKRIAFERAYRQLTDFYDRQKLDVTDPLVQERIGLEAYKVANKSIFLGDNFIASKMNQWISENVDPKTGHATIGRKAWATAGRFFLPIVRVPTNIAAETMMYAFGLPSGLTRIAAHSAGLPSGYKAAREALVGKRVAELRPEEADQIMRELKKGSIGAAFLMLGFFGKEYIGGFYEPGDKRKKNDVKFGSIKVGGVNIPSFLLHNPLLEVMQLGSTIRRVTDKHLKKNQMYPTALADGVVAGAIGISEELPFVREMTELDKLINPATRDRWIRENVKSFVVPSLVSKSAEWLDMNRPRVARNSLEAIQGGIPGIPGLKIPGTRPALPIDVNRKFREAGLPPPIKK